MNAVRYATMLLAFFVMVTPASATPQPADCTPVAGADPILVAGSIVLLGEIHGTAEAPEAAQRLVCRALELGSTVTVGLELPQQEQEPIEEYLDGPDGAGSRQKLLAGAFWQRNYQDGRTSQAMFELLVALRRHRATTKRLRVVVIDNPEAESGRDAYMAHRLNEEISRAGDDVFVVLTGNLHNRLTVGTPFNPALEPMGYLLRRELSARARLTSLRITHRGGAAWVCTGSEASDCGTRELEGQDDLPLGIKIVADPADAAFSGRYHVGKITASPPAKTSSTH